MSNGFVDWYRKQIRNSKYRWIIVLGTLAYLLSPIDLLPDVIPIIGQIDDVLILTILVTEVTQMLSERIKVVKNKDTEVVADRPTPDAAVEVDAVSVE